MDINSILRGYSAEQFCETLYQTIVNYLCIKGIIDIDDFAKFQEEKFSKILQKIIDRDRAKAEEVMEKYKKELEGNNE